MNSLISFKTFLIYNVFKKIQLKILYDSIYCSIYKLHAMYQVWWQQTCIRSKVSKIQDRRLFHWERAAKFQQLVCTFNCQLSDFYQSILSGMEIDVIISSLHRSLCCHSVVYWLVSWVCCLVLVCLNWSEPVVACPCLTLTEWKNDETLSMLYVLCMLCALSVSCVLCQ